MPVEFTKPLTPEMQMVADCREAVVKAEGEVERLKGELKVAKSLWETAVEDLNRAVDEAIGTQRQPTLFSGVGDDLGDIGGPAAGPGPGPDDKPPPRTVVSEPTPETLDDIRGEVFDAILSGREYSPNCSRPGASTRRPNPKAGTTRGRCTSPSCSPATYG